MISNSTYGKSCRVISEQKQIDVTNLSLSDYFISGAITGVVQTPARQIMERIKSVMQVHENSSGRVPYKWTGDCVVELIRKEGFRNGLFQGMSSVFLREVPQFAVYYPTYEFSKSYLSSILQNDTMASFLSGGIAGIVQWLPPIYCADVVKSRMQTAPKGYYLGISDCIRRLYREEGPRVFFRGLSPALLRAFPLHATIFVVYEHVLSYLKSKEL